MYKENGRYKKPEKADLELIVGKVFKCTNCNTTFHIETSQFGEPIRCTKCKNFLIEECQ